MRGEKIPRHPVDSSVALQDGFLGGRSEDLSHYGVEFMSDAQRRDKLPLMNGPTANSWPSSRIRTEKVEKDETGESLLRPLRPWPFLHISLELFLRL